MFDWLKAHLGPPSTSSRWVALDLETSGLDPKSERIVEIGAVAVHRGVVDLPDFFHRFNAEGTGVSRENRVLHGVTAAEQQDGTVLSTALDDLLGWMRDAPLVGFHTTFDLAFLRAALAAHFGDGVAGKFGAHYLDLAVIAPMVFPKISARGLGEWTLALKLPIRTRHRALADALATAHLLQVVLAALPESDRTFEALKSRETGRRWL
jgi:DNA polymerase-3 subunit epsilon